MSISEDLETADENILTVRDCPRRRVIETLALPKNEALIPNFPTKTKCFLCEIEFDIGTTQRETFLAHSITNHKLVIGDVDLISDLTSYVDYWRKRFQETKDLSKLCAVIRTNSNKNDPGETDYYFFLNDTLPEDKAIREQLHKVRLDLVIQYQEEDRLVEFNEMCLFCSQPFAGDRLTCIEFFRHMNNTHQFNIGHPDNMVFVNELIETLRSRLGSLQCLTCSKLFKDRSTLKDHMRKKTHRGLSKDDRSFDKFYLVNYLEIGKRWTQFPRDFEDENDGEWVEVNQIELSELYCFFCDEVFTDHKNHAEHLYSKHDFDFQKVKDKLKLSFYEQMKLINWIRKEQVDLGILNVMETTERILAREWDNPQYYFPTYQHDDVLHMIDYDETTKEDEDNYVYMEDCRDPSVIRSESVLKDLIGEIQEDYLKQKDQRNRRQRRQNIKKTEKVARP